jgi:hypothetical protein
MWFYPAPIVIAFFGWAYVFLTSGWLYIKIGLLTLLTAFWFSSLGEVESYMAVRFESMIPVGTEIRPRRQYNKRNFMIAHTLRGFRLAKHWHRQNRRPAEIVVHIARLRAGPGRRVPRLF